MRPLHSTLVAGVLVSLALPGPARAAGSKPAKNANTSPAATLLAEGRRLMAAGNYSEACPKIAESQSQAPSPVTAMTLAGCYQKAGKLATAWATYRGAVDGASSSNKKKIAQTAKHLADTLEPKLSRLTIKVSDPTAVEVKCDGETVHDSDLGTAVPYDGGGHDIEASEAGKKTWKKHVELAESGQNLEVDVPRLESETPEPAASTGSTDKEGATQEESSSKPPSRGTPQRITGIAIGGLGVAAVALGAFAGLHANSTYNDAISACGGNTSCTSANGLSLRSSASSWATISTVSFVVGGAALAGGAVLFFTAPHDHDAQAPAVGVGPATLGTGLSVVGRY